MLVGSVRRSLRAGNALLSIMALVIGTSCGTGAEGHEGQSTIWSPGADWDEGTAIALVDDTGSEVVLSEPATRVIALAPSITETLIALGAGGTIVGRTIYDRSPGLSSIPAVGDLVNPSLESIVQQSPDLVVSLAGNSTELMRRRLSAFDIPLFAVTASDTADIFRTISNLGVLTGYDLEAYSLITELREGLDEVRASVLALAPPSVLYLVWHDPPLSAGPGTYLEELIEIAGGRPAFPELSASWPELSLEAIVRRQPDLIVVSIGDEPSYDPGDLLTAPGWRELRAVREGRVYDLPVDIMNRPGPQIVEAARLLRTVFFPELDR